MKLPRMLQTYPRTFYPPWWEKTITLYNKCMDNDTNLVIWYRTHLDNCSVMNTHNQTVSGQTVIKGNNIIARIPKNDAFKPYHEWFDLPEDERCNYFTLNKGDIIIVGEFADYIDEYSGLRSTALIEKYKRMGLCFSIDEFRDNTGIGKVAPHYYAGGE